MMHRHRIVWSAICLIVALAGLMFLVQQQETDTLPILGSAADLPSQTDLIRHDPLDSEVDGGQLSRQGVTGGRLEQQSALEGWVLGDGLAIMDALVTHGGASVTTNEEGFFRFNSVKSGTPITTLAEGWAPSFEVAISSPVTIHLRMEVEYRVDLSGPLLALARQASLEIREATRQEPHTDREESQVQPLIQDHLDDVARYSTKRIYSRSDGWPPYEARIELKDGRILRLPFIQMNSTSDGRGASLFVASLINGNCNVDQMQFLDVHGQAMQGLQVMVPTTSASPSLRRYYRTNENGMIHLDASVRDSGILLKTSVLTNSGSVWLPTQEDVRLEGESVVFTVVERYLSVAIDAKAPEMLDEFEIRQVAFPNMSESSRPFAHHLSGVEPLTQWMPVGACSETIMQGGWVGRYLGVSVRPKRGGLEQFYGPTSERTIRISLNEYGSVKLNVLGALSYVTPLNAVEVYVGTKRPQKVAVLRDTEMIQMRLAYGTYKLWLRYPGETMLGEASLSFNVNSPEKQLEHSIDDDRNQITVIVLLDGVPLGGVGVRAASSRMPHNNVTDASGSAAVTTAGIASCQIILLPRITSRPVQFESGMPRRLFLGHVGDVQVIDGVATVQLTTSPVRFLAESTAGFSANLQLRTVRNHSWTSVSVLPGQSELLLQLPAGDYVVRAGGPEQRFIVDSGQFTTVTLEANE